MSTAVTEPDAIARLDANLLAASGCWALATPIGDVFEDGDIFIASAGAPLRSFNVAFLTDAPSREALARLCDYFQARGVKFRVRAREDVPLDESAIDTAGLERRGGIPSLALAPIRRAGQAGVLAIRPVHDTETLQHHVEVVANAFGWEPETLGLVFTPRLLQEPAWRGFVGYVEGRPVASLQVFVTAGVAGIYYVATLNAYRRRGFGEAITWHAISEGVAMGCDMASLQASPLGLAIYERMGFRQVSYYRTYVPKEA